MKSFLYGLAIVVASAAVTVFLFRGTERIAFMLGERLLPVGVALLAVVLFALPAALISVPAPRPRQPALEVAGGTICLVAPLLAFFLVLATPLARTVALWIGRGVVVVAVLGLFASAAGAGLALVLSNRVEGRTAGRLVLTGWNLTSWVLRLAVFLGSSAVIDAIVATVPWPLAIARIIVSGPFFFLLILLRMWLAVIAGAAFDVWILRLLSAPPPEKLSAALRVVGARVRLSFRTPIFLVGVAGSANVAEVHWRPFLHPVLIVSRQTVEALDAGALEAVLAHEAAHVLWGHLASRLVSSFAVFAALMAAFAWLNPTVGGLGMVVAFGLTHQFVMFAVIRRQEEQADLYAAETVDPRSLLDALAQLSDNIVEPYGVPDLSIWTTHGSWRRRRDRLVAMLAAGR